eukprot:m.263579 g.263579  ORF g.263579 m.263579 type:complete len:377 (-) comp19241_c0_seq14:2670-3800(-)
MATASSVGDELPAVVVGYHPFPGVGCDRLSLPSTASVVVAWSHDAVVGLATPPTSPPSLAPSVSLALHGWDGTADLVAVGLTAMTGAGRQQTLAVMIAGNEAQLVVACLGEPAAGPHPKPEALPTRPAPTWYLHRLNWGNPDAQWHAIPLPPSRTVAHTACLQTNDVVVADEQGLAWRLSGSHWLPLELPLMSDRITHVACGKTHCLLLSARGAVFSFGLGSQGELGHGSLQRCEHPATIEALEGMAVKHIACGGWHSICVTDSDDVYTFGRNHHGQLGRSVGGEAGSCTEPALVDMDQTLSPAAVVAGVSAGTAHSFLWTASGTLLAWGCNRYGQTGLPGTGDVARPTLVPGGRILRAVSGPDACHSLLVFSSPP